MLKRSTEMSKQFSEMTTQELREYAEMVQAEYDAGELEGPSGRQIVRDAWTRVEEAEEVVEADVTPSNSQFIYTATMTPQLVVEAIEATKEDFATMTDAEVFAWAGKWTDLAVQAPWNPMAAAMAEVYINENARRRN
jgi:hypothetical protein